MQDGLPLIYDDDDDEREREGFIYGRESSAGNFGTGETRIGEFDPL